MKKAAIMGIIILLATTIIAGCSFSKAKNEGTDQKAPKPDTAQNADKSLNKDPKASGDAAQGQNPGLTGETPAKPDLKRDSGRYVGQIDNNFIEVKISGVPESMAARSFMLGDKVKSEFEKYQLKTDDPIQFAYTENSSGQRVIMEIKKL